MRLSTRPQFLLVLALLVLAFFARSASAAPAPRPAALMPRAAQSLLIDLARAGDRLVAVGERGHVLFSDDSGQSWTQAPVPVDVMLTAVCFADARHGWAVGHDGMIIASDDGGSSWRLQRDGLAEQETMDRAALARARADVAALEAAPLDAQALQEARVALEEAEERAGEPTFAPPLMDVWIDDAGRGIAVGAFGSFLRTEDGGRTWVDARERLDNPDELHLYAIAPGGGGRLLLVGETGAMFRSLDAGASWDALASGHEGTLFGALALPGTDTAWAFGLQGKLLASGDFGVTWTPLDTGVHVVLAGATVAADGAPLVVGSVGAILRPDPDSGQVQNRGDPSLRSNLSAIAVAPDGNLVVAGQGGVLRIATAASGAPGGK